MTTYTTVQGDMWDSIAYSQMGSVYCTELLLEANLQYHDLFSLPAGLTLTIPDAPPPKTPNTLPPWKR